MFMTLTQAPTMDNEPPSEVSAIGLLRDPSKIISLGFSLFPTATLTPNVIPTSNESSSKGGSVSITKKKDKPFPEESIISPTGGVLIVIVFSKAPPSKMESNVSFQPLACCSA